MIASSAVAISLPPASVVAEMQDAASLSWAGSLLTASVAWHLAAFAYCAHAFIIDSKTGSRRGSLGRPRRLTVVLHPRSADATASICAGDGVAGSFASALVIFACSLSIACSQTSSEPVSTPVGAALVVALGLGLRLGLALGLTGAVGVLEPPLHPVRHRTTADATVIMILREPASSTSKQPAGLPVRGIKLLPAAVTGVGVLPAGRACITTFFGPMAEALSRAVGDRMETAWRPRGGSLPLHDHSVQQYVRQQSSATTAHGTDSM